ncbi:MAG: TolC family protein [Calditrichaeota bacterium]|nr:TolC family protein [Candidatus Cloacimonadota bacterium]MCA9787797.1 TolC family protein [Candidatus Cloacimonadota bacterium]MCB1046788.1 TolC family protein [Calditrichota bacterium]MCB9472921.1 TolC family protein [Candidatus Delongbacteria bacterium]
MRSAISLCVTLFLTSAAFAETLDPARSYTFADLYAIGGAGNTSVASAELDVNSLRGDRLQALGTFLPTVDLSANTSRTRRETFDYVASDGSIQTSPAGESFVTNSNSWSISASQDLFKGFETVSNYRLALLAQADVRLAHERAQLQLHRDLRRQVHQVIARRELLGREEELLRQNEEQHRLAQARFEVGAVTQLDVLQTEIDLGSQQLNVENARQELRSAWDALAVLIGLEPGVQATLDVPFDVFQPTWQAEDLVAMAEETRYELVVQQHRVESARWSTTAARARFMPNLSLGLDYSRSINREERKDLELFPDNNTTWLGLNLRLPLFTGFTTTNTWQHRRADEQREQLNLEQARRQARSEIGDALARLGSSWEQSRVTEKNRELARRSFEMEEERYRLGLATLLNVQSARATLRQAETGHIQQQLDFLDRLADLELSVGRTLR